MTANDTHNRALHKEGSGDTDVFKNESSETSNIGRNPVENDFQSIVEDTQILSPSQTLRYNIFKSMYADILYRWELLMQRCEIVKTIDSGCLSNFSSSSDHYKSQSSIYNVGSDSCYKIRFKPKLESVSNPRLLKCFIHE